MHKVSLTAISRALRTSGVNFTLLVLGIFSPKVMYTNSLINLTDKYHFITFVTTYIGILTPAHSCFSYLNFFPQCLHFIVCFNLSTITLELKHSGHKYGSRLNDYDKPLKYFNTIFEQRDGSPDECWVWHIFEILKSMRDPTLL